MNRILGSGRCSFAIAPSAAHLRPQAHPLFTRSSSSANTIQPPTIFALGTPPGKAGVAVLRISGPAVPEVYRQMVFRKGPAQAQHPVQLDGGLPPPRKMVLREIRVPSTAKEDAGEVIDEGLVVFFPGELMILACSYLGPRLTWLCRLCPFVLVRAAPNSFTTQPLLELHTHSSLSVLTKVLSSLSTIPNLRPAERGEFTRQAFLAGRMDLTEVEGLRDLIEAETEGQRKLARGMVGVSPASWSCASCPFETTGPLTFMSTSVRPGSPPSTLRLASKRDHPCDGHL